MEDDDDPSVASMVDPTSDLFFTLVAVVLPAILLLLPLADRAAEATPRPAEAMADALAAADLRIDGTPPLELRARPDGLIVDGVLLPLDAVLADAGLRERLAGAAGAPILLMVEPGGEEAAFLLDAAATSAGVARLFQLRLDDACAFARSDLVAAACRGRPP